MLRTTLLVATILALAGLAPLSVVQATTTTQSFSQTITFDGATLTVSGTFTIDTTAQTLSGTTTVKEVNSTTGATIFSQTFMINLSFGKSNSVNFVLTVPAGMLMLGVSCKVTTGSAASCFVSKTPDIDHNGTVDIIDAGVVFLAFGAVQASPRFNPAADLNGNGQVDIIDAGIVTADFGASVLF